MKNSNDTIWDFFFNLYSALLPLASIICTFTFHLISATFTEISPRYCLSALSLLSVFLLVCCAASLFHLAVFAICACSSFCCSLRRRYLLPMCYPDSVLSSSSYCHPPLRTFYLPVCGPSATSCVSLSSRRGVIGSLGSCLHMIYVRWPGMPSSVSASGSHCSLARSLLDPLWFCTTKFGPISIAPHGDLGWP